MAQKRFVATDDMRQQVERLVGVGCTVGEVLNCCAWGRAPISEATLRQHFAKELARGQAAALSRLKGTAFDLAVGGDKAMLIFLLKVRCGWRETVRVENTGADGQPLPAPASQARLYLPEKNTISALTSTAINPLAAEVRLSTKDPEPAPRQAPRSSSGEPLPAWHEPAAEPRPRVAGAITRRPYDADPRY